MLTVRALATIVTILGAVMLLGGLFDKEGLAFVGAVLLAGGLISLSIAYSRRPAPDLEALWRLRVEHEMETRRPRSHADLTGPEAERKDE